MTGHFWTRPVECLDTSDRARTVTVYVDADGTVGITTPPGETAKLRSETAVQQVIDTLIDALAERRRMGGEGS